MLDNGGKGMKQVYKVDSEGFYMEPVILEDNQKVPANCVVFKPQNGLFKPKLNMTKTSFIEGLSQTEINALKNVTPPLTELEQLKKQQADLVFTLMMNGVI
jgi:hypothetical protein